MLQQAWFITFCLLLMTSAVLPQTRNCFKGETLTGRGAPGEEITEAENKLCAEIKKNRDLKAIYGFVLTPKFGRLVRVYRDRAVFTFYNNIARYQELELKTEEFENFQIQLAKINPSTQPPIREPCTDMCSGYEFISLTRKGGRRVPIFASYQFPPEPMRCLQNLLKSWESSESIKTHYYLQAKFPEAKVVLTNENYSVRAVWKSGDDLRVLVVDKTKPFKSTFSWRRFSGGEPVDQAEQPRELELLGKNGSTGCGSSMVANRHPSQRMLGEYELCVGTGTKAGLWKVGSGEEKKISDGEYDSPLVTPDGKWIIAAKGDKDKPIWKSIVRIDAETNREYRVDLPVADCFYPSASVPVRNKILLVRCKQEHTPKENNPSPDPPEFYLFDPQTGEVQQTKDEIRPLMHQSFRFLQPTQKTGEFWAAIPDPKTETTRIGRYDVRNLEFTPVLALPSIIFYSYDLWMDEEGETAYIVYDFQLLSVPLSED